MEVVWRRGWRTLGLVVGVVLMTEGTSRAGLLVYEPFDYGPVGADLLGQSGGGSFGFASPWSPGGFNASINNNYDVGGPSLSFGSLLTNGGRVSSAPQTAIAGITRSFSTPIGTPGTVRYYSFLLRPEQQLNQGAFNGFLGLTLEAPDPVEPELFVGKPGGGAISQIVIEDRGGTGQVSSGVSAISGQTNLLVVRAQFTAGNDTFTLYVNPTPGAPEPVSGGILKNDSNIPVISGFTIYSTGAVSIDELRLGETFADVTPVVPEPASLGILLATGMLVRRRRRK
jgi:hypothetical protein